MLKEKREIPIRNCDYWLKVKNMYQTLDDELTVFQMTSDRDSEFDEILKKSRQVLAKSFSIAEKFFEKS